MNKILLWGLGKIYNLQVNLLRYFEMLGHFEVVGVTGNLADPFYSIDGYRFYSKEDSQDAEADYVIVMDNQFNRYKEEAEDFGFRGEQIFPYWILQIPNFDFEKYLTIRREKISIISNNCWGGIACWALGMECCSPFKNLFVTGDEYLRLLQNLKYYMDQPLSYVRESYDAFLDRNYPVMRLDDIEVHCNHYDSPEDAILKWNERKEKIDYDHLYVKFDTILPEQAEQFAMLHQYERKVCFVPFEPRNACEMKIENRWGFDEFWKAMMANASLSGGASCNLLDIILGERILRYQI